MDMIKKKVFKLFFIFCIVPAFIYAQTEQTLSDVPDHFGKIYLGMTMNQVKEALQNDENFHFTGDPDISILHRPNETLIECSGTYFIDRAFFQFYEDKLYTIILSLNSDEIDHYSMYTTLSGKYGKPDSLNPQKSVWESEKNILSLERPLVVKYIDRKVLDTIRTSGRSRKTLRELSRQQFLRQF